MKSMSLLSLPFMLLFACSEGEPPAAAKEAANADSPNVADTPGGEVPVASLEDPKWRIAIEGQPMLEGGSVMNSRIGELHVVNLLGANAMVSFNVKGSDAPEPYLAQIGFIDSKLHCARGAGEATNGEVLLELAEDRIMVSGVIGCRPPDGERSLIPISGYFPAPGKR